MVEIRRVGDTRAVLWVDGREAGAAEWVRQVLRWGREEVQVVQVLEFHAPAEEQAAFRAYLRALWQGEGVAVVRPQEGKPVWFSAALRDRWEAAGAPNDFCPG